MAAWKYALYSSQKQLGPSLFSLGVNPSGPENLEVKQISQEFHFY